MNLRLATGMILLVLASSCAQMAVPTGGEKDRTPPQLVEENCIPRNGSTGFRGNKIRLEFDEYVRLNNAQQQVLISPALNGVVKFVQKGKTVELELPGELLPNTTYTIFFGQAVSDITEGNVANNLMYVFSTGDHLDSLQVNGTVINAFSTQGEKGVVVGLWPDEDSAFYTQKPRYLSISNEKGNFYIRNVAAGNYRVYALRDLNANLLYDAAGEEAGFVPGTIQPSDSAKPFLVPLIKEQKEKWYIRKREFAEPGRGILYLSRIPATEAQLRSGKSGGPYEKVKFQLQNNDTLHYRITDPEHNELLFSLNDPQGNLLLADTIRLSRDAKKYEKEMSAGFRATLLPLGNADRYSFSRFSFADPVSLTTGKIVLLKDSLQENASLSLLSAQWVQINYDFKKAGPENYTWILPEGEFTDVFGRKNTADTLRFKVHKEEYYGKLLLQFDPGKNGKVLLQLLNDRNQVLSEKTNCTAGKFEFPQLKPGTYQLRVIIDADGDGKWSQGEIFTRTPPEKVILYPQAITIRSNWDFEIEWKTEF